MKNPATSIKVALFIFYEILKTPSVVHHWNFVKMKKHYSELNWDIFGVKKRTGTFSDLEISQVPAVELKLEYIGTERLPYRWVALHVILWSQIHLFVTHVFFLHLPDLLLIQSVFLLHFPELLSTTPRELAWPLAYTFIYRCSEQYSILITILRAEACFPSLSCFFNSQEQRRVFWSCWQNWRRGRQFKGLSWCLPVMF